MEAMTSLQGRVEQIVLVRCNDCEGKGVISAQIMLNQSPSGKWVETVCEKCDGVGFHEAKVRHGEHISLQDFLKEKCTLRVSEPDGYGRIRLFYATRKFYGYFIPKR